MGVCVLGSRAWEVYWEGTGGKAGSDDMVAETRVSRRRM